MLPGLFYYKNLYIWIRFLLIMNKEFHILNGDSLKTQFPKSIKGENIIARLCLVDGNVKANTLEELFEVKAEYLSNNYTNITKED